MPDNDHGIGALVKDARYMMPLIGIILLSLLLLFFKDLPNWARVGEPVLIIYVLGSGLIAWIHSEYAYILADEHPKKEGDVAAKPFIDKKISYVKNATIAHAVWLFLLIVLFAIVTYRNWTR